jgi:hypothetical protein
MKLHDFFWEYGEKVPGYDTAVVNEREARAAAGIMGTLGMIVIFMGIGFNHIIVARVFLAFLFIDFTLRMFSPKYVPSLMLARIFIRHQKPEYVGGLQKRFAWTLGWLMSLPLMWWFVINWDISFYKVLICVVCLILTFLESAFGICLGCILYKWITRKEPKYCPGGTCEIRTKDPIQKFNPLQTIIGITTLLFIVIGAYLTIITEKPTTFFGEFLHETLMTKSQLAAEEKAAWDKAVAAEFGEDD